MLKHYSDPTNLELICYRYFSLHHPEKLISTTRWQALLELAEGIITPDDTSSGQHTSNALLRTLFATAYASGLMQLGIPEAALATDDVLSHVTDLCERMRELEAAATHDPALIDLFERRVPANSPSSQPTAAFLCAQLSAEKRDPWSPGTYDLLYKLGLRDGKPQTISIVAEELTHLHLIALERTDHTGIRFVAYEDPQHIGTALAYTLLACDYELEICYVPYTFKPFFDKRVLPTLEYLKQETADLVFYIERGQHVMFSNFAQELPQALPPTCVVALSSPRSHRPVEEDEHFTRDVQLELLRNNRLDTAVRLKDTDPITVVLTRSGRTTKDPITLAQLDEELLSFTQFRKLVVERKLTKEAPYHDALVAKILQRKACEYVVTTTAHDLLAHTPPKLKVSDYLPEPQEQAPTLSEYCQLLAQAREATEQATNDYFALLEAGSARASS